MTYRIQRSNKAGAIVLALSGEMDKEHAARVQELLGTEGRARIFLDLREVTLVDRAAVQFLARVETEGVRILNCSNPPTPAFMVHLKESTMTMRCWNMSRIDRVIRAARVFLKSWTYAAVLLPLIAAGSAAADEKQPQDQELQLGDEMFEELKAKGEIIESSPLYDQLQPLADALSRAAQPHYNHPFKFYLVHEPQPNAFATPGGKVYVVDSLLYFVKNTEELAGTLCHEVSHTIHRDGITLMKKHQKTIAREVGAAVLVGPTGPHVLAIALLGKLRSLGYSREAESRADLTGSDVCAQAGYNPWGLVWLFEDFKNARARDIPQLLSDHPNDQHRIDALTKHMRDNPSAFGKYSPERTSATPFSVPKSAPVVFLR